MHLRRGLIGAGVATLVCSSSISTGVADEIRPLRVDVGGSLAYVSGFVCFQTSYDTDECLQPMYAGADLGVAWQPLRNVSVGGRFQWAAGSSRGYDISSNERVSARTTMFQGALEVRGHLGLWSVDPWVALDLGMAWARDLAETTTGRSDSMVRSSVLAGGSIGLDIPLMQWISLAPEVRLYHLSFPNGTRDLLDLGPPVHRERWGIAVGMSIALRPLS